MRSFQKGFTLIELLVVIGIVGILLSITLVAINPARQFRLANDSARAAGINTLSSAVSQLIIDNRGAVPTNISVLQGATYYSIYYSHGTASISNAFVSLCTILTGTHSIRTDLPAQTYLPKLPADPRTEFNYASCGAFALGYSMKISNGRVYVTASTEEPTGTIEAVR